MRPLLKKQPCAYCGLVLTNPSSAITVDLARYYHPSCIAVAVPNWQALRAALNAHLTAVRVTSRIR